jgi:hypothetical protein
MKLTRIIIGSFRHRCQLKINNIEAFMAAQEDVTSARLEKLQWLTTALTDQWKRMEMAWFAHLVPDPISSGEAELLMELGEIVEATGKAVDGMLTASQQFNTGKLGETLPEPGPRSVPTNQIRGRVRFSVAAEAATGALAEANAVAQMATEDKATFLKDAVDVEARTLAEAGGETSLEADGGPKRRRGPEDAAWAKSQWTK